VFFIDTLRVLPSIPAPPLRKRRPVRSEKRKTKNGNHT